tara:strand:- start:117 stop:695 length:579 start_codon:yes stop_codon:yes gene_type:complete
VIHSSKFVFAIALFGFSSVATAKTRLGFTMGGFESNEASLDGYTYKTSGPSLGASTGFLVGQQFTPNIEVGGRVLFSSITEEASGAEATSTDTGIAAYLDYNFNPDSGTVFFAGPRFGVLMSEVEMDGVKQEQNSTFYGAGGGVKHFLNPRISLDGNVYYYMGTSNTKAGGQESPDLDLKMMGLNFGISAWL